ncbi:efflux RND transporter permease subunit [Neorickettsia sp. 179522]|uniref:efflux RND transporter permease subunit n=1 Tax=Neorickettsia sp. 179522 TaxID=1714371 RepID=UPI00060B72CD|nr:efflux RND transporter permease subunit [Neorickettsia sp. 179522]KYH12328.1 acriflavine resistance protein B [Neorickettsia sp. 179522]
MLDFFLERNKAVLVLWFILIASGVYSCFVISKEQTPNMEIPYILVNTVLTGVSAEDSTRFLSKELEDALQSVEHLKSITSQSFENASSILMEFEVGFDSAKALASIRDKLDQVVSKLPKDTLRPTVEQVTTALIPAVVVTVSSDLGVEEAQRVATQLRTKLNALPNVLSTNIIGKRKKVVEIAIDPKMFPRYNIGLHNIVNTLHRNNILILSGSLPGSEYPVSTNGLVTHLNKLKELPISLNNGNILTLKDIADVNAVFEKEKAISRIGGVDTVVIEVSKASGKNLLETVRQVREEVSRMQATLPDGFSLSTEFDTSTEVKEVLTDLKNSIVLTIIMVVAIMVIYIGWKMALMTACTVPGSIFIAILLLYVGGFTMNIVVLFSLIMSVGMIVDAAVIVNEYADRRMLMGSSAREAYTLSAKKMFWPVLSSTATTLIVLVPLLFWPGLAGEFMKFLPITLIFTLSASVLMSVVFTPVIGSMIGTPSTSDPVEVSKIFAIDQADPSAMGKISGKYCRLLEKLLDHPKAVIAGIFIFLVLSTGGYYVFGKGLQFLPNVEPKSSTILIKAVENLTLAQKRTIVETAERTICETPEIRTCYTKIGTLGNDVIGSIQVEFAHWKKRRKIPAINDDIERRMQSIKGIQFELFTQEDGPIQEKPIKIVISGTSYGEVAQAAASIEEMLSKINGTKSISDDTSAQKLTWEGLIDRNKAALYGVDVATVGQYIALATSGITIGEYRGDDHEEKLDIVLTLPEERKSVSSILGMTIPSQKGMIRLSSLMRIEPVAKTTTVKRFNSEPTIHVYSDVQPGFLSHNIVKSLRKEIEKHKELSQLKISFKGEQQDQSETTRFLVVAFFVSTLCMVLILLLQFNSFSQVLIILTAVALSTGGVTFGLLITHQPFIVVMSGIGIISLAGIVVNNNILLIDAYNDYISESTDKKRAIIRAAISRFRPILLTSGTTILGLLPMVFCITIDLVNFTISYGAPATQWWQSLATTVAGGLSFTTLLTLILTPALLMLSPTPRLNTGT